MGALFLVRHRTLGEVRVLKVMQPVLQLEPRMRSQLLQEARAATEVRHLHIVRVLDFLVAKEGTAFLIMERLDGVELRQIVELAAPLPPVVACAIAQQALEGLGHMHARGFLHRDIAPDNLMLVWDEDGRARVKILDLGIAKGPLSEGLSPEVTIGSFCEKALERFRAPVRVAASGGRADSLPGSLIRTSSRCSTS